MEAEIQGVHYIVLSLFLGEADIFERIGNLIIRDVLTGEIVETTDDCWCDFMGNYSKNVVDSKAC
jgi:hypothetical protein